MMKARTLELEPAGAMTGKEQMMRGSVRALKTPMSDFLSEECKSWAGLV